MYTDGTYLKNNPNWHSHESPWKAKEVVKAIKRNNLNASSICEVGCGSGETLKIISEQLKGDITFTGYDISPQAFEICSKKSKNNLRFYLKDLTEESKAAFDILLILDVVEHIDLIVPGATHLFEEPGTLESVAQLAADWFVEHCTAAGGVR